MKKAKKLFINLAAGVLATTSVATVAANTNQVNAVQTTAQDENNEQDTLVLNHKTCVYNKKGKSILIY